MLTPIAGDNTVLGNNGMVVESTKNKMLNSLQFALGFWYSF